MFYKLREIRNYPCMDDMMKNVIKEGCRDLDGNWREIQLNGLQMKMIKKF